MEVCVVVVVAVTMIKGEYTMADRDRFLEGSILSVPINYMCYKLNPVRAPKWGRLKCVSHVFRDAQGRSFAS